MRRPQLYYCPRSLISPIDIAANHLAQLVFFGELSAQDLEVANQALAAVDQSFLGGDLAIGLNAELEGGKERVRD